MAMNHKIGVIKKGTMLYWIRSSDRQMHIPDDLLANAYPVFDFWALQHSNCVVWLHWRSMFFPFLATSDVQVILYIVYWRHHHLFIKLVVTCNKNASTNKKQKKIQTGICRARGGPCQT